MVRVSLSGCGQLLEPLFNSEVVVGRGGPIITRLVGMSMCKISVKTVGFCCYSVARTRT